MLLNEYYAKRYKGRLLVRFDDTNPSKEKEEFEENIMRDLRSLGIALDDAKFVTLSHTSDHFAEITERARQLLRDGKAYMDDTPQEQMREEREQRANSKHRDDDAKQGLAMFERMCAGDEEAGKWCLRAKIDMASNNGTLRDPVP